MKQRVSMIAAVGHNRVMGIDGKLPWDIPEDLKRFKGLTQGKPIIMGRKTYDSIGCPLPGRMNVVITRNKSLSRYGVVFVSSLREAFLITQEFKEVFIIGGSQIYEEALPYTNMLYLTWVDIDVVGDTYFPNYVHMLGECLDYSKHSMSGENGLSYMFIDYEMEGCHE